MKDRETSPGEKREQETVVSAQTAGACIEKGRSINDELRLQADAFEYCAHGIALDLPGLNHIIHCNQAFARMLGRSKADIVSKPILNIYAPEDHERVKSCIKEADRLGHVRYESLMVRADGSTIPVQMDLVSVLDESGTPVYRVATAQDITDRKEAEEKIRRSEASLREAQRVAKIGNWTFDRATGEVRWSDELFLIFGIEPSKDVMSHELFLQLVHPEDRQRVLETNRKASADGEPFELEYRIISGAGNEKTVREIGYAKRSPAGEITGLFGTAQDITERKRAETSLRESEERLRLFFEHAPAALAMFDQNMHYLAASRRWMSDYGLGERDIFGCSHYDIFPEITEELKQIHRRGLKGEVIRVEEARFERADGSVQYLRWEMHPWRDDRGEIGGIVIFTEDITERNRAEESLRDSEARFRLLIEGAPEAIFVQTSGIFKYVNHAMLTLMGAECADDLVEKSIYDFIAPEFHESVNERIRKQIETEMASPLFESEYIRLDGSRVPVETTAVGVRFQGQASHLVFVRDITARRKAEAERANLEAQLWQAQKMESIGRLAGGVAHDFNNLLTGIMLNAELCQNALGDSNPARSHLDEIIDSAERSAGITRQLLTFARRQAIIPIVLDLNDHVTGTLKLLRRLIGEDIELAWLPQARHAKVRMDPTQIDQILANLMVNARDAIAGVGTITIETGDIIYGSTDCIKEDGAAPGAYVKLSVKDSGCGMDRKTLACIFEPFFTTKTVGRGTGLGLATIYGIITQNGGFINVDSEPGMGTTFRIYLRRHEESAEELKTARITPELLGGNETIMLVEDERTVRITVERFLQTMGYNVIMAADPDEALRQSDEHLGTIHLLLTDVVMPGMNGWDLAAKLAEKHPEIKCLYISGYTPEVITQKGFQGENVNFLAKPFTRSEIGRKVREVLNSHQSLRRSR